MLQNAGIETLLKEEEEPSFNIPANSTLAAVVDPSPLRSGLKCYHQSVRPASGWTLGNGQILLLEWKQYV